MVDPPVQLQIGPIRNFTDRCGTNISTSATYSIRYIFNQITQFVGYPDSQ